MSIATEIQRLQTAKSALKTSINAKLGSKEPIVDETLEEYASFVDSIPTSAGGAVIKTAELPNVTIKLLSGSTEIESKSTGAAGGVVSFTVSSTGTYEVQARDSNSTLLWSNDNVAVSSLAETLIAKPTKLLENYTWEEIHTACQGGYSKYMWTEGDMRTIVHPQATGVWHNKKVFIEQFVENGDGTTSIDWRSAAGLGTSLIYPAVGMVTSITVSDWRTEYTNKGGFKYCNLRREFMEQGEDIYSQVTGILPSDYSGTLTTGVKLSDLVYTQKVDEQNVQCKVYAYSEATDTFTETTTVSLVPSTFEKQAPFMKGYFKSVGKIDETTFNAGNYYTFSNNVYTRATTYASGTTYYGLYETLQDEGSYLSALPTIIRQYMQKRKVKASAGGDQRTHVVEVEDYLNLPAIEEMFGINFDTVLKSGKTGGSVSEVVPGEGTKLKIYDDWTCLCAGSEYWTRSSSAYSAIRYFHAVSKSGGIAYTVTTNTSLDVRAGFRTC